MIWYTHTVKDGETEIFPDLEVELDIEVSMPRWSEPKIEIRGVWKNGVDLLTSKTTFLRILACNIIEEAERDDSLVERALADAGLIYRSEGYGDPEGHWMRATA